MKKQKRAKDPVDIFLTFVNNKSKVQILRDLLTGTKTFNQLLVSTRCLPWTLLWHLKTLTAKKLISTTLYADFPIRVEYTLTRFGESLKPILNSMAEWGLYYREHSKH